MAREEAGWRCLAIAIVRRACQDIGAKYLETEDAKFYMLMSDTNESDYKRYCEQHDRNLAYAIQYYYEHKRISMQLDPEFKNEILEKKC